MTTTSQIADGDNDDKQQSKWRQQQRHGRGEDQVHE